MKITHSQIEQLYTFTQQHYVKYYDVQSELVDHLAQDIENQWEIDPNITFENALNKAFKKFGIFGFEDVVLEKTKALQKRYYLWLWQNFKSFFKFPQIIGTFMALFIVFKLLILGKEHENVELVLKISFVVLTVLAIIKGIIISYNYKKEQKEKKYLMEEIIFNQGIGFSISIVSLIFQLMSYTFKLIDFYINVINSFLLVLMVLIIWISFVKIPSEAQKYLKITYGNL
jgi:hypothetical protein